MTTLVPETTKAMRKAAAAPSRIEMIEAAAEAIRDVVASKSGGGRPWSALPETLRDEYRKEAEAALRAAGAIHPMTGPC
jgi:hypothetical protein